MATRKFQLSKWLVFWDLIYLDKEQPWSGVSTVKSPLALKLVDQSFVGVISHDKVISQSGRNVRN